MSKAKFSPIALDQLLNETLEDTKELQNELQTNSYDESEEITPVPGVSPQINNMVNQSTLGQTVDYSRVYSQLERLIENGNIALQVIGAIDPDVSGVEVAAATASLMNAIKNCVAEFTKIHMQHIKFQQKLELMRINHEYKMTELQQRKNLIDDDTNVQNKSATSLIEWQTDGVAAYLKYLQEQKGVKAAQRG